jgi:hypothetical protein
MAAETETEKKRERSGKVQMGREFWIDFVADTGADHDVSLAVGRMLFAEYALSGGQPRRLPRGDILVKD